MAEMKRVYILVKTYPTISEKYSELVCTAGLLEDGSWIRLYPVPFRLLNDEQKYPKYTWINAEAVRNTKDFRPESYRPINYDQIHVEQGPKRPNWDERRRIISKAKLYTNLSELIAMSKSEAKTSLAVFKPTKILDLVIKPQEREWDRDKLESLRAQSMQVSLFKTFEEQLEEFRVVDKVPYKFSYRFLDDSGRESTLMIEDWELGALYFNCLKRAGGNEDRAIDDVKKKYFDWFLERDVYFFLGTTLAHHGIGKNPFIIIGVFYPPVPDPNQQMSIFDMDI